MIVDPEPILNTPPRCGLTASAVSIFSGDAVELNAFLDDDESIEADLSNTWLIPGGVISNTTDGLVTNTEFPEPGDYPIGCFPFDGTDYGEPSYIVVSVVERPVNTPPNLKRVSPLTKTVETEPGRVVTVPLKAVYEDVDEDAVTVNFEIIDGPGSIFQDETTVDEPGETVRYFRSDGPGYTTVNVRAFDENGAPSDLFEVSIVIVEEVVIVDADGDGYPSGLDCDDGNPDIRPGAPEICGDGIDQDCSGADVPEAACDLDGDGFSALEGDCDDTNRRVFPGAFERCNGRDDNCAGGVDEGYEIGAECAVGVGACRNAATLRCSADGLGKVCGAVPGLPEEEICDGIDNDCNQAVDDVSLAGTADVDNCGGCNVQCVPEANQVPACEVNAAGGFGCQFDCATGFIDLNREATDGCEYACIITNGGEEVCDGLDNDCDGEVDEGN